jgi:hypothetical protein
VTYREQNDKLYVFDASESYGLGPVFNPEVVIEAYPIVHSYDPFDSLPGSAAYVLIDPSAGLNKFDVVSDAWAPAGYDTPVKFETELSFLQRFKRLADGVQYQQVFTGYADRPDADGTGDPTQQNTFEISGTLTISLRKYKEGAGFVAQPAAPMGEFFFKTQARHNSTTGDLEAFATRWNIHPGMQPIKWKISRELPAYIAAHPELASADIVGAVKRGIENWNQVFGYPVFKAELAGPDDAFGDDDKNFFIFDPYPGVGYARANWRTNPLSGEIRGASVYFGAGWLNIDNFSDDESGSQAHPAPTAHHKVGLRWAGVSEDDLCAMFDDGDAQLPGDPSGSATAAEKLSLLVQHIVTHEVGHNLGLRHNFKGSLLPPSSTVMDYTLTDDRIATAVPQAYDIAAIEFLYGLAPEAPSQPFCTDATVATDPECRKFDAGERPLHDFFAPRLSDFYAFTMEYYGFDADWLDWASEGALAYARSPFDDYSARDAYELTMAPVRAPLDPAVLASLPFAAQVADGSSRMALEVLFGQRKSAYGVIANLPTSEVVLAAAVGDLRGNLTNADGIRSFETRRSAVDILKKVQRVDAYRVLLDARAQLAAELAAGTLAGDDAAFSTDLLARIDAAISPYFL